MVSGGHGSRYVHLFSGVDQVQPGDIQALHGLFLVAPGHGIDQSPGVDRQVVRRFGNVADHLGPLCLGQDRPVQNGPEIRGGVIGTEVSQERSAVDRGYLRNSVGVLLTYHEQDTRLVDRHLERQEGRLLIPVQRAVRLSVGMEEFSLRAELEHRRLVPVRHIDMAVIRHKHTPGCLQDSLAHDAQQVAVRVADQDPAVLGVRHVDRSVLRHEQVVRHIEGLRAEFRDHADSQISRLCFLDFAVPVHRIRRIRSCGGCNGRQEQDQRQEDCRKTGFSHLRILLLLDTG